MVARRPRHGLTTAQVEGLWDRWRRGDTLSEIARALDKHAASIFAVLRARGGIAPVARSRAPRHLSCSDREEVSRGLAAGDTIRAIAKRLDRLPSTICREIQRNGGRGRYRAVRAEESAWDRSRRPKACKLSENPRLRALVAGKLKANWSPEQISGWLKRTYPDNDSLQVSHETIYRSLFIQARGVLKKELLAHLRTRRKMRKSKHWTTAGQTRGQIIDAVSISERPASVKDRAIPGHWEGDLVAGAKNSHIATLVERKSRYTILVRVRAKDTTSVVAALTKQVLKLPVQLRRSLTWDRGSELANHRDFRIATDMDVYFCDPKSPWQRGTNENTNRLLRQYFPKGTDLSGYTQPQLDRVARELNQRPRKTLGFQTPADKLSMVLQ